MKQYSFDSSITEFMECPCKCECGRWFDLEDGFRSNHSKSVVCPVCHAIEETEGDIENIKEAGLPKREEKLAIAKLEARINALRNHEN